ncbi:MAG: hypothetical protein ACREQM_23550 [Candidatus Dormibacteraceae bacterium]
MRDRIGEGWATRSGRPRVRAIAWAVAATLLFALAGLLQPGRLQLLVQVWAVLLGVIALGYATAVMLRHVPIADPPRREVEVPRRLRLRRWRVTEREAVPGLTEMERMVVFGQASAYDFESRLRPHLAAIAEQRLLAHGLTLQSAPDRVSALLGDAWELVRPDYEPIGDRQRHGVPRAELARCVEALDAL